MKILVTGGAGYIGSHTCIELLAVGHEVVIVDNLSNSSEESMSRVEKISGKKMTFINADIRDEAALDAAFSQHKVDAVIHFAGLKAVGESTEQPLKYYDNNVSGSRVLMQVMEKHNVNTLVFSSSATVYGDPATVPITEDFPLSTTNPYGQTKLVVEQMCRETVVANNKLSVVLLRYFNPVGAHISGTIGEDPKGIPNNLMPFITQVAVGKREFLSVFGDDYDTVDGTGVRDYIHVVDLAKGHVQAIEKLHGQAGCHTFNLGTGQGYSVLEMVAAFSKACNKEVPYKIIERRAGDIGQCYADPAYAQSVLDWQAEKTLDDMVNDSWRWQSNNPDGYNS
ncbi:UDP-glucose 4-epimerase GalE [Pseudocolwellia sp. AS88]|uniref:UDP-glucose 4-epimerase GalE n=1 Tax=Pseudocolwellia sp. AS88 TaxID=3063958 RepID=UPI0026EC284C|nr:UDP-glucose 4-epimerase GalE [Pseudocolwellia sp. AS88]MDO7084518.1 UDP-glucose 4-epimerase GalE [Pseudocolwellia sp. AS88]